MRISDWSSDVCSSDLAYNAVGFQPRRHYQVNDIGLPYSDEELLDQIRRIYREQERLTIDIIDKDPLTPSRSYFIARFGGFRNIVRLAGLPIPPRSQRSEERRGGEESVSTCRERWRGDN